MWWAAGVELFSVLSARKLLILGMVRGKKGTIADSIVRLLYENAFGFGLVELLTLTPVSHRFFGTKSISPTTKKPTD